MSDSVGIFLFLSQFKRLLKQRKIVFRARNNKTVMFLLDNDMNANDALALLENLDVQHFQKGPEEDHNGTPGNVMVFLLPWKNTKLYIKLKIWKDQQNDDTGCVISFHD